MAKKTGLGRGLEHLISQNFNEEEDDNLKSIKNIGINEIKPNPYQPRKNFDLEALNELSQSIKEQGIFQPILLRKSIIGYEIISGERRFRAAKIANLKEVPAVIYDYSDQEMMEVALIENIQREDLTIVEEAKSYSMIIENLKLTQEEMAKKVGKSRPHISNTMRILKLDKEILDLIDRKDITMGHVKVLITIEDKKRVTDIVKEIIEKGLSVRQAEQMAKDEKKKKTKKNEKIEKPDHKIPRNKRLENTIREKLDTKVNIKGDTKGLIEINFNTEDDLGRILEILNLV